MRDTVRPAEWTTRGERGALWVIRLATWLAVRLGRSGTRGLLAPVCLYFLLVPSSWQQASRAYLPRALGRAVGPMDGWRHCHSFACCLLDRIYMLRGQTGQLAFTVHGAAAIERLPDQSGCLLLGAHLGSFEAIRAAGHGLSSRKLSLLMYRDNARKTGAALAAINPALELEIIALGRPGAMLAVRDRLAAGHMVGVLADRGLSEDRRIRLSFLGAPAWFPEGPFRLAALLRQPVVLMLGLYRGGARYDIIFERIDTNLDVPAMMRQYVSRLEHHCRGAPYNWFNFYDFWA